MNTQSKTLAIIILFLLTSAFCFGLAKANPDSGPVAYWKLDEGSGAIAIDNSENGNTGTIVGATYSTDSAFPDSTYSLLFTGPTGYKVPASSYVSIPDSPRLRPASGITIEAWVKAYSSAACSIVSKEYKAGGNPEMDSYILWYWPYDNTLNFVISSSNQIKIPMPSFNEWHNIVATWDGSLLCLYVDGVEQGHTAFSGPITYDSNPVLIGADVNLDTWSPDSVWDGLIDNVRIYDYARTPAQILSDYQHPVFVTPEYAWGTLGALVACFAAVGCVMLVRKRKVNI